MKNWANINRETLLEDEKQVETEKEIQDASDQLAESDAELQKLRTMTNPTHPPSIKNNADTAFLAQKLEEKNQDFDETPENREQKFKTLQSQILEEQENYRKLLREQQKKYKEQQKQGKELDKMLYNGYKFHKEEDKILVDPEKNNQLANDGVKSPGLYSTTASSKLLHSGNTEEEDQLFLDTLEQSINQQNQAHEAETLLPTDRMVNVDSSHDKHTLDSMSFNETSVAKFNLTTETPPIKQNEAESPSSNEMEHFERVHHNNELGDNSSKETSYPAVVNSKHTTTAPMFEQKINHQDGKHGAQTSLPASNILEHF